MLAIHGSAVAEKINFMGHFSIRVVDLNGKPCKGIKVFISFGTFQGHDEGYTDIDGWVEFSNLGGDLMTGEVFIHGLSKGKINTASGKTYSFTVD